MKPIKLILCGWGPYKEKQEIEFDKLDNRGLFLITGATGAGKTTIFDAITYALYGNMSGMVREKNSVRSDFAKGDEPTYVELYMTHGKEQYHIYRNPEYMRPKKRKTGTQDMTKEKERAVLTYPSGEVVEGSSEVTRRIQELLRLDYRQFKQLSLIAQGEFAKLLTASSSEKSRIFREIFDTEMYDKVTGELRMRSGKLYKQVMEYRHKMEEDINFFVPLDEQRSQWEELTGEKHYYYDKIIMFLDELQKLQKAECEELQTEMIKAEQEAEHMTALLTEAERESELFEKHGNEIKRREQLKQKEGQVKKQEEKVKKAEKALAVKSYEQTWQHMSLQVEDMENSVDALNKEVMELQSKQEAGSELLAKKLLIETAYEEEERRKELLQQKEDCKRLLTVRQKELEDLQKAYLNAEKEEDAAKTDYESTDRRYRYGMAGILASELRENMPCPVCGSLEHPKKAVLSEDIPTKKEVEQKKHIYEALRQESEKTNRNAAVCKEKADALSAQHTELCDMLMKQEEAAKKREVFVADILKAYTKQQFLKQKTDYEMLKVRLQEKLAVLTERQEELRQKHEQCGKAFDRFMKSLAEKDFACESDYREAFLPEEKIAYMREEIAAYKEAVHANEQLIVHMEQELKDKKLLNISELKEQLEEKKQRRSAVREEWTKKSHYESDIRRLISSLKDKLSKVKKLEDDYGVVKRLEDAASGNNRLRLVFEQYVLAAYFEEILKAANIRLKVMSTGRYELRRAESVGDGRTKDNLEMEVLDYYTGKYRSVKTLSGGESFKTSLALALGMSDVVQALSGGVRVEALFIDEGFGSLDSESLEQACLTLQSLVEKERLIGIISHVPELAEKIGNQIRINKTNAGSNIEVMVS